MGDLDGGEGDGDANDTETQAQQGAASEISELLGEMEAMAMDMPGKGVALKGALDGIMAKFDKVVLDTFKKALNETQHTIEQNVRDLEKAHNKTMFAKKAADSRNVLLSKCRDAERQALENLETCIDESMWANRTRDEACKAMDDAKLVKWSIDENLTSPHLCDVSDPSCPKLEQLKVRVDGYSNFLDAKRIEYWNKNGECNSTTDKSRAQAEKCADLRDQFLKKKARCDSEESNTHVAMCAFGHRLQEQCDQLDVTNDFNNAVRTGTGTPYSEPDRQENFAKVQTMKCSLQSYTAGGMVTENVRQTCATTVDYKSDVGVIDYKPDRILGLLHPAPPKFTCKETEIEFEGPSWDVGNTTARYVQQEKTNLLFNVTPVATPPFAFCASNHSRARCRGFKCPKNWVPKADRISSTCELKTCSRHECCAFSNKTTLFSMSRGHTVQKAPVSMPVRNKAAPHVTPQTLAATAVDKKEVDVLAAAHESEAPEATSLASRALGVTGEVGDIAAKGARNPQTNTVHKVTDAVHNVASAISSGKALAPGGANAGLAAELASLKKALAFAKAHKA